MRRALSLAVLAAIAFGVITLAALEAGSMAVLRTTAADGTERRTRVWFAERDGALWIESATADRPFYLDLTERPALTIDTRDSPLGGWISRRGTAELVAEPGGHATIRSLLAARYGWADRWVAMLQDTSRSRAVRIVVD